ARTRKPTGRRPAACTSSSSRFRDSSRSRLTPARTERRSTSSVSRTKRPSERGRSSRNISKRRAAAARSSTIDTPSKRVRWSGTTSSASTNLSGASKRTASGTSHKVFQPDDPCVRQGRWYARDMTRRKPSRARLRPFRLDDAAGVCRIYANFFVDKAVQFGRGRMTVAISDGRLAGFVLWGPASKPAWFDQAETLWPGLHDPPIEHYQ